MTGILFEKDWLEYPTADIDQNTPNKSFLRYASGLKKQGVKNWMWPLAILHTELKGVDPFDPNLTFQQKTTIALECKLNPWYFFREVARVPGSTLENPIRFRANRSNMAMYWLYFNHITVCLVQLRQTGKTFGINTLDAYLLNIGSIGCRTVLLTKDEGLRATSLTEIKSIEDLYPDYLRQHHKLDIGNREEINVGSLDNNYKGMIARNDPIAADKTARGHKIENTRTDETAYLFYVEIAVRTMLAATTAARTLAEMKGIPYGNIFTTTAGKKDDRDGGWAYNYFHSAAPWTEFFMDCKDREELNSAVRGASRDGKVLRVHATFSHRQLGYTDAWLNEVAIQNNSTGEAFERDYLNRWTSGSQLSPFTVEESARIRNSEADIRFADISRFGQIMMRWYYPEEQIDKILQMEYTALGLDTSDGMGKDDIAILIRHLKTGEVLGACSINEINLITVSNFLVDVLKTYPRMIFIPERRNQAATIIDYMLLQMIAQRMNPFKRIYNTVVQDHVENPERYQEIQKSNNYLDENFLARHKKFFGFTTSGQGTTSRSELYGNCLKAAVKYTGDLVRDKPTVDQLLSLVVKDGRVDHPKGGHDDLVISWLLSYWFMLNGRNLQFYDIPNGYVLSSNTSVNSVSNREEQLRLEQNHRARATIEQLIEMIRNERDQNVIERAMMEIENIKYVLGPEHEISHSVDEMLLTLRKNRSVVSYVKRSIF